MSIGRKGLVLLTSWIILFLLQLFFNLFPVFQFWPRVFLLSSVMLLSTFLWIKLLEGASLKARLGLDVKGVTVLTFMFLAVILVLFTRDSFREAALLTGGSFIIPLFEELFFRAYLLGSMVKEWPNLHDLPRVERIRLVKLSFLPLLLTSLSFALVHDDVIAILLNLPLVTFSSVMIILIRVLFSMAIGSIYLLKRSLVLPTAFHLTFNLSYYLITS